MASDRGFKRDLQALEPVLDRVTQLRRATYGILSAAPEADHGVGLIVQEVLPLFPELVTPLSSGDGASRLTVDYAGFSVVAIAAIQEQQRIIEDLRDRLEQLEEARR